MKTAQDHELVHAPGAELNWQESVFLTWWDEDSGIGGVHRLAHEPNRGTGNVWCGILTRDGSGFRRDLTQVAVAPDHRGLAVADYRYEWDEGLRLRADDGDLTLDLAADDLYPATSLWDRSRLESVGEATISNHTEASGRIRGTVGVGGQRCAVTGWCHRDHSWGPRDWGHVLSHRWFAGTCGEGLSFSAIIMQGVDYKYLVGGAVVRHGVVKSTTDVDIAVVMEADGISHRGGTARMRFDDGEELVLEAEPIAGVVFDEKEHVEVDTLCHVTASSGHRGFCDFEVSNGLRRAPIHHALRAATGDGLITS